MGTARTDYLVCRNERVVAQLGTQSTQPDAVKRITPNHYRRRNYLWHSELQLLRYSPREIGRAR
jgi:hypothetical protein